ncbi:anti-sigma factor [Gordonia shandongensis]|uniref:anti-sigma factor n=1 Tax=Gordonia shandongensis TaxID=376351 RepID=UPI00041EC917|nr:anti-sigma factor [Gordonia shandongensis]
MGDHPNDLLALYALDVLDEVEAARVRRHVHACADCDEEVAMWQEEAARLGDRAVEVPPDLRRRVLAAVDADPTGRRSAGSVRLLRGRRAVAAAAVVLVAAGGGVAAWRILDRNADPASSSVTASDAMMDKVLSAPDMRKATGPIGGGEVKAMYAPSQRATVVTAENLPPAPDAMGYQVWITVGGRMKSAGMVTGGDSSSVLMTDMDRPADVSVSVEPMSGSSAPSSPMLVSFPMP